MASKFNVDFLRRSDLQFELYCRNYRSDEVVDALRKKLRLMLAQDIAPDKTYILTRDIPEQLALCKQNLDILKNDSENLCDTTTSNDAIRFRDRLNCFINRLSLLKQVCLDNDLEESGAEFDLLLQDSKTLLIDLNGKFPVPQSRPLIDIPIANNPNLDPNENLCAGGAPVQNDPPPEFPVINNPHAKNNPVQIINFNQDIPNPSFMKSFPNTVSASLESNPNLLKDFPDHLPHVKITTPYSKMNHPVIKLLADLPPSCDGLSVTELLKYLRVVLRIVSAFPDLKYQIFSLLVPYTRGPLLSCLLKYQKESPNFDLFHKHVILSFIPERQLLDLKQSLFLRKQEDHENLADYVRDIKESAVLLHLNLCEEDVVNNILEGINYKVRACCTFSARPRNFSDLDSLCIEVMNIQFIHKGASNFVSTRSSYHQNRPMGAPPSRRDVICHNCKKPGHIRPQCPALLQNRSKNL